MKVAFLHTMLDLRGNIPAFVHISDGKLHDANILDQIDFEDQQEAEMPDPLNLFDKIY